MINVFTAFSGYDSQCMALDELNIEYDLVGWSDIDKNAIKAHNAIYPQWANRNYGDIRSIDWDKVPSIDLFTYSFPCQDISNAGRQRGLEEGSGTRSSLLWECEKAISTKKPRVLVMENVSMLACQKFKPMFEKWLSILERYGYRNYYKLVKASECGIPQNRVRLICVSIIGGGYNFPNNSPLFFNVDSYLDTEGDFYYEDDSIYERDEYDNIKVKQATKKGYLIVKPSGVFDASYPNSKLRRGRVQGEYGSISPTLTCGCISAIRVFTHDRRVRRITSREAFRLMGVRQNNIDKLMELNLSEQQYGKLAGNSIVVDVLMQVFSNINELRE